MTGQAQPSNARQNGGYMNVNNAADHIGMTPRFIRKQIAERRLPFYRAGRSIRIAVNDLDAFMEAGRVEPWNVA